MEKKQAIPSINVDYFQDLTEEVCPSDQAADTEDVGKRIRAIREQKGLSLEKLSQMTGFDQAELAGIEEGKIHPQLGTIMRLSRSLDGALSRLVSGQGSRTYEITRKGERKTVARGTSDQQGKKIYTYHGLAHDVHGRNMEPLIVELLAVPDAPVSKHDGEEFIFVLSGTALLKIGNEEFALEPGDSVYYLSATPHSITAKTDKASILAVLYE